MTDARDRTTGCSSSHDDGTITLVGGYSPTSGRYHFPLLDTCPYTGATDVERGRAVARPRTLWAWTAVTAAPPGYEGPVPYGFGVVELDARAAAHHHAADASPIPARLDVRPADDARRRRAARERSRSTWAFAVDAASASIRSGGSTG